MDETPWYESVIRHQGSLGSPTLEGMKTANYQNPMTLTANVFQGMFLRNEQADLPPPTKWMKKHMR
jgi:hypothetical protein